MCTYTEPINPCFRTELIDLNSLDIEFKQSMIDCLHERRAANFWTRVWLWGDHKILLRLFDDLRPFFVSVPVRHREESAAPSPRPKRHMREHVRWCMGMHRFHTSP